MKKKTLKLTNINCQDRNVMCAYFGPYTGKCLEVSRMQGKYIIMSIGDPATLGLLDCDVIVQYWQNIEL